MKNWREYLITFVIAAYVFSISNAEYNALTSISMGLGALIMFVDCYQHKSLVGLKMPQYLPYALCSFGFLVLIAAMIVGQGHCIHGAITWIEWIFIPFLLCRYLVNSQQRIEWIGNALFFSVLFTSSYSIYSMYCSKKLVVRIGGLYACPNFYSVLLIMILPFLVLYTYKYFSASKALACLRFVIIAMGTYALYLTGSRGAVLGLFVSSIFVTTYYFVVVKKSYSKFLKFAAIALLCGGAVTFFATQGIVAVPKLFARGHDAERVRLWTSSINMWKDHKVAGVGVDNWIKTYFSKYKLPGAGNNTHSHNVFLWYLSNSGILGAVGYLVMTAGVFYFLLTTVKNSPNNWVALAVLIGCLGCSLHGMVDMGITMKSACRLFHGLLGVAVASSYLPWDES